MQSFSEKLVRFVRNGALILTFAAMVTTGYAQLANGVVTGVVQDSSGAAVP